MAAFGNVIPLCAPCMREKQRPTPIEASQTARAGDEPVCRMSRPTDRELTARKTSRILLAPLVRPGPLTVTVFNCRTFIINVIVDVCSHHRHCRRRVFLFGDIYVCTVRVCERVTYVSFTFRFEMLQNSMSVHRSRVWCVRRFNMDFTGCCCYSISLTICHFSRLSLKLSFLSVSSHESYFLYSNTFATAWASPNTNLSRQKVGRFRYMRRFLHVKWDGRMFGELENVNRFKLYKL